MNTSSIQIDNTLLFKRRPRRVRSSSAIKFPALPMEDTSMGLEDGITGEDNFCRLRGSSCRLGGIDSLSHLDLSSSGGHGSSAGDSLGLSNDGSGRFRFHRRRMDQQMYSADRSTRPLDASRMSLHAVTERPEEELSEIEEDTPKVLVFRRPKRRATRRSSTWY